VFGGKGVERRKSPKSPRNVELTGEGESKSVEGRPTPPGPAGHRREKYVTAVLVEKRTRNEGGKRRSIWKYVR